MRLLRSRAFTTAALLALTCLPAGAQEDKEFDVEVEAKLEVELALQGYPRVEVGALRAQGLRGAFGRLGPEALARVIAAFDSGAILSGPHREVSDRQAVVAVFRCVSAEGAQTFFTEMRAVEARKDEELRSGAVAGVTLEEASIAEAAVEGASAAFKARKVIKTPDGLIPIRRLVFVVGAYVVEVGLMGESEAEHVAAVSQALVKALTR